MSLPRDRARQALALVIAALLVLAGVLAARGALWFQTGDFFCFYQGARSLALGHDPYDASWWSTVTGGVFPDPWRGLVSSSCATRYAYPLWTAVALLPVGVLPLEVAASAWMTLSIGAAALGASALWRAYGGSRRYAGVFAAVVFSSQPFSVFLVGGQITAVELGLLGLFAISVAKRHERSAGLGLALLALKPQLVVLTLPALLARVIADGRARLARSAIIAGVVMVAVPFAFVPLWPLEWVGEVGPSRLRLGTLLPTAWGFSADILGDAAWGAVIVVALVAVCLVVARDLAPLPLLALSLPLSLVATPHAWSYDFLVCAASWAFVLTRVDVVPRPQARAILVALLTFACVLPWVLFAVGKTRGLETLSVAIPAGTALLVAYATRLRLRRDKATLSAG